MTKMIRKLVVSSPFFLTAFLVISTFSSAAANADKVKPIIVEKKRVVVNATGIPAEYVDAMAKVLETTLDYYEREYKLDMPVRLTLHAILDHSVEPALWIKDAETIEMRIERDRELQRPQRSRVDVIYGLTYRLADLGRLRTLGASPWLTDEATRGLSHYCACNAIEYLSLIHGRRLWPDEYDYRETGIRELEDRMSRSNSPPIILASAAWHDLTRQLNNHALGEILTSWRKSAPDARRPKDTLENATQGSVIDSHERSKRRRWFRDFAETHIEAVSKTKSKISTKRRGRLMHDEKLLKYDDDSGEEGVALQRNAHIITFKTPEDQWYLTEVQFFAERFGKTLRRAKEFEITVRDSKFQPIASWKKPYGLIRGRSPQWYTIQLDPVPVGDAFAVTIEFDSRNDVGIRLFKDISNKGNSAYGDVRRGIRPLADGDWMIRAVIDRVKDDNPLIWRP